MGMKVNYPYVSSAVFVKFKCPIYQLRKNLILCYN